MSNDISKENDLINGIHTAFVNIEKQILEVTNASEENSASTEEILAEIEEQNRKIINIQNTISELDKLCIELKGTL